MTLCFHNLTSLRFLKTHFRLTVQIDQCLAWVPTYPCPPSCPRCPRSDTHFHDISYSHHPAPRFTGRCAFPRHCELFVRSVTAHLTVLNSLYFYSFFSLTTELPSCNCTITLPPLTHQNWAYIPYDSRTSFFDSKNNTDQQLLIPQFFWLYIVIHI